METLRLRWFEQLDFLTLVKKFEVAHLVLFDLLGIQKSNPES